MPDRRVNRQARGAERRREVLDAALRVIGRDGLRAVTHRAVAAEAGTSLSATTYYFESGRDMIVQAFAQYVDERITAVEAALAGPLATGALSADEGARLLTRFVLDELASGGLRISAEYQLALEGVREPEIAEQFARLTRSAEERLAALLDLVGSVDPPRDARVLLATVRGLEIDEVTRPEPSTDEEIAAVCRRTVTALLAISTDQPAAR